MVVVSHIVPPKAPFAKAPVGKKIKSVRVKVKGLLAPRQVALKWAAHVGTDLASETALVVHAVGDDYDVLVRMSGREAGF